jgi:hypothetical protein
MTRRSLFLPVVLALCGCSSGQQAWVARPHGSLVAWDGLGRDPTLPAVKRALTKSEKPKSEIQAKSKNEDRTAELAGLREYSREWAAVRKAIDAEEDARVANILVICRGC